MPVTIDDLAFEIKQTQLDLITDKSDFVAARCIEKAVNWAGARLRRCGIEVDQDDPVVRDAIIKRALYELYAYVENEEVASDKREDAVTLLRGYFGDCVDGDAGGSGRPVISVKPGSDNWNGYS